MTDENQSSARCQSQPMIPERSGMGLGWEDGVGGYVGLELGKHHFIVCVQGKYGSSPWKTHSRCLLRPKKSGGASTLATWDQEHCAALQRWTVWCLSSYFKSCLSLLSAPSVHLVEMQRKINHPKTLLISRNDPIFQCIQMLLDFLWCRRQTTVS